MPRRVLAGFAATLACALLDAASEEIVLPSPAALQRWITIEFGNPGCPSAGNGKQRRIVVSPDGYACTSTPMERGWVDRRFSSADSEGRWINVRARIHQQHSIEAISSGNRGERTCKPDVLLFWYGDREKIAGDSSAAYRERHQECPQR